MMVGSVGILNVGAGDTKLTFDPSKPEEVKRSARIVEDMLKRGFVLLIEVGSDDKGPLFRRAAAFDPDTAEYIIAGDPPAGLEVPNVKEPASAPRQARKGKAASARRRVPAASTNAVAVARTAGG
jgi:hypothetical protein